MKVSMDMNRNDRSEADAMRGAHEGYMTVHIIGGPSSGPGELAQAELHFEDGPLAGWKLIGFSIWQLPLGADRIVTFPASQYVVNGERRRFVLLRPITSHPAQQAHIRELILEAYAAWVRRETVARTAIASAPAEE